MNKYSSATEEPLLCFSLDEIKQINVEKDIKYIVKIKPHNEGYCYVVVLNPSYCDVDCDNARLVRASGMKILSGEHGEYSELLNSKTIIPNFR